MSRKNVHSKQTESSPPAIVYAIAERPFTLALRTEAAKGSIPPERVIYLDRGVNVLSAKAPSWELLEREPGTECDRFGLRLVSVGVRHTLEEVLALRDGNNKPEHDKVQARLVEALKELAAKSTSSPYFSPRPRKSTAEIVVGTLAEIYKVGWGTLEKAALLTGGANARGNQSFHHLGVLHDEAMMARHRDLVEACRKGAQRFKSANAA